MSTVGGVGGPSWANPATIGNKSTGQTTQAPIGAGNSAPAGAVPGTSSPASPPIASTMMAMLGSLHSFMPEVDDDQQDVTLAEVTAAMKKLQSKTDDNQVTNEGDQKKAELDEREKKLKDAAKKAEEAANLAKHGSFWDKIKAFFEMIGAALAIVVGALLSAVPGMQAVGALLMVAGVMGMILAIDDEVKQTTGLGIAGNIDKLVHPNDPDSWAKADMGFEMAVMAVALVAGIAASFADPAEIEEEITNISAAVSDIEKAISEGEDVADDASDLTTVSAKIQSVTTKMNDANDIAQAAGSVDDSVNNYQISNLQAQSKQDMAKSKEMEAVMDSLDQIIELAIHRLAANGDRWSKMVDSVTDAMKDRSDTLSKAKLTA